MDSTPQFQPNRPRRSARVLPFRREPEGPADSADSFIVDPATALANRAWRKAKAQLAVIELAERERLRRGS